MQEGRDHMRDFKHSLLNYSIKRLLQGIPLIILVVLFSFAIIQFAPGEPISLIAGGDDMTQAVSYTHLRKPGAFRRDWRCGYSFR